MDQIPVHYLILIYIIGFTLLLVELLVPGFIMGTIGLLLIAFAIAAIFWQSTLLGIGVTVFTFAAVAVFLRFAIRRVTLRKSLSRAEGYSSAREELTKLVGQEGVALTTLRPAGTAEFDGDRVDVVTGGEMIEKDSRIKVIEVEGNRVVVRTLDVSE